jgi:hypothetical protein
MSPGMGLTTPTGRYSPLDVVLVITTLPTSRMIKQSDQLCKACLKASKVMSSLAGNRNNEGCGILTAFPHSTNTVEFGLRIG